MMYGEDVSATHPYMADWILHPKTRQGMAGYVQVCWVVAGCAGWAPSCPPPSTQSAPWPLSPAHQRSQIYIFNSLQRPLRSVPVINNQVGYSLKYTFQTLTNPDRGYSTLKTFLIFEQPWSFFKCFVSRKVLYNTVTHTKICMHHVANVSQKYVDIKLNNI